MRTTTQRNGDALVGLALAAFGVWGTWVAVGIGLGTSAEPGPGMFPAAICTLLTMGGLGCAWRAWYQTSTLERKPWIDNIALNALEQIAMLSILFVPLGMPLAGFIFVCGMTRTLGKVSWRRSVTIGLVAVLAFWLIFDVLLSVQIPYGWWMSA
jgi:putative tricarboxylic transport membrane protein